MYGFMEIDKIIFEKNSTIIEPAEERLKNEFRNVKTTYIPQQSIIRIDYVNRKGKAKIIDATKPESNVQPLNKNIFTFN